MIGLMISNDKTGVKIEINQTDLSEATVLAAYNLAFGNQPAMIAAVSPVHPGMVTKVREAQKAEAAKKGVAPVPATDFRILNKETEAGKTKHEIKSRPRQVKLVGSGNTASHPVGEVARFKEDEKRERVRVYVDCPGCYYEGETYSYKGNFFCKCPTCDMKLFNSYATDIPLEVDKKGFMYRAVKEMHFRSTEDADKKEG